MIAFDPFNRCRDPEREAELVSERDWLNNENWLTLWYWYMELRHPSEHRFCDEAGEADQIVGRYRGAKAWLDCYAGCGLVVPILIYVHQRRWLAYALEPQPTAETAQVALREAWDRHLMPYDEYLKTQWWRWQRANVLGVAENGHVCRLCHGRDGLNVHHNTYARRGFEEDEDLSLLCRRCHKRYHAIPS